MFASSLSQDEKNELLDWTAKQGRILTANNLALDYFKSENGFGYKEDELPHHHLINSNTKELFLSWIESDSQKESNTIRGAYDRPLFYGGWENSTNRDEFCFNVQTSAMFIDIRIPKTGTAIFNNMKSISECDDEELKLFARRHVFGGFTKVDTENGRMVCTRHHCMDWNFTGNPRPRPNKWYVEIHNDKKMWKEWSYARDNFGQHYYCERWIRHEYDALGNGFVLAMHCTDPKYQDGLIVAVGNHFNYLYEKGGPFQGEMEANNKVELVDNAIATGRRHIAEKHFLSIEAGHGSIMDGWKIQHAIQPWCCGTELFSESSLEEIDSIIMVTLDGVVFRVLECSVSSLQLNQILKREQGYEHLLLGINSNKKMKIKH